MPATAPAGGSGGNRSLIERQSSERKPPKTPDNPKAHPASQAGSIGGGKIYQAHHHRSAEAAKLVAVDRERSRAPELVELGQGRGE
ncbi:hypothetical protein ZHAS_00004962 [Anopheles sinensis]|uniref:Uncharacterized protein n=1 Tax=Anopheles sinensis TaxID=74873 RepID=A0A084VIK2_ANOSI|nr:hypothetical protein ZHAS_00004962 [Anopheles sinensis]